MREDGALCIGGKTIEPAQFSELINRLPKSVEMSEFNMSMNVGETATLTATVLPSNALDKSLTWSSSDTSVATVNSSGKVTAIKPGTAYIIAKAKNGVLRKCTVKVTKEKVIVSRYEKIGDDANGELRVQFTGSGKVWRVVNKDTIYYIDDTELDPLNPPAGGIDPEKLPPSEMDLERCYSNLYVGYDPSSQNNSGLALRVYTDDEIKLLYALDPYGVADYVQRYSLEKATGNTSDERVSNAMRIKDHYFEVIFGKAPLHYTRTSDGVWLVESNPTNLADCYSDSESIFGMHMVWDEYLWKQISKALVGLALEAMFAILGTSWALKLLKTTEKVVSKVKKAVFFAYNTLCNNILQAGTDLAVESLLDGTCLEWVSDLYSLYGHIDSFVSAVNNSLNLYPELFDYYIEELNHSIYIEIDEGTYKLEDIRELLDR